MTIATKIPDRHVTFEEPYLTLGPESHRPDIYTMDKARADQSTKMHNEAVVDFMEKGGSEADFAKMVDKVPYIDHNGKFFLYSRTGRVYANTKDKHGAWVGGNTTEVPTPEQLDVFDKILCNLKVTGVLMHPTIRDVMKMHMGENLNDPRGKGKAKVTQRFGASKKRTALPVHRCSCPV